MNNYSASDFSIVSATRDYGVDSTLFQAQSTASFTIQVSNYIPTVGNISGTDASITKSLRAGWLTGRRPVTGQLFPRGVYNK